MAETISETTVKALRLSEEEIKQIDAITKMLGSTNFSEGLRWAIETVWSEHGDEITRIAKERDAIKPINIER